MNFFESEVQNIYYSNQIEFIAKTQQYCKILKLFPQFTTNALEVIPLDQLHSAVEEHFEDQEKEEMLLKEYLIVELMDWFKNSFFQWMDSPKCEKCQEPTLLVDSIKSNQEEKMYLAGKTEIYNCPICSVIIRFPRYQHPKKLLATRTGRCGEWAICFTYLVFSMGYKCRLVIDWTDHVWTEVFFESCNKWVHFDCCENIFDSPLVYEKGWGKNLSYVIAFSLSHRKEGGDDVFLVQDVTWRYVSDFSSTLRRRNLFPENWLVIYLISFFEEQQAVCTPQEREQNLLERLSELASFLMPSQSLRPSENQGRNSGSLSWRQTRQEYKNQSYVFSLTETELKNKVFTLGYSITKDKYVRSSNNDEKIGGWESCTYLVENIFRKTEHDWKQIYLARNEGCAEGKIAWKFEFTPLTLRSVVISASSTTFEQGSVLWNISSDNVNITLPSLEPECTFFDFKGCSTLTLTATLFKGSWQHAQLFRRPNTAKDFPLMIKFTF